MSSIVRTYHPAGGHMVHDGYFIITKELPMKWVSIQQLARLENAI